MNSERPPNVVVVDDRTAHVLTYGRVLHSLAHAKPACFTDPELALRWCDREQPDLVIVEHAMAPLDGLEFARRFRARDRHEAVLAMLAEAPEPGLKGMAHHVGVDLFIVKPVRPARLRTLVEHALSLRAARARIRERNHAH